MPRPGLGHGVSRMTLTDDIAAHPASVAALALCADRCPAQLDSADTSPGGKPARRRDEFVGDAAGDVVGVGSRPISARQRSGSALCRRCRRWGCSTRRCVRRPRAASRGTGHRVQFDDCDDQRLIQSFLVGASVPDIIRKRLWKSRPAARTLESMKAWTLDSTGAALQLEDVPDPLVRSGGAVLGC